jgi:ribosomal protein L11 methyltransferase
MEHVMPDNNRSKQPQWLQVSLRCPESAAEAVSDLLGVLSGSAVEQSPVKDGQSAVSGFFQFTAEAEQEQARRRLESELAELFAAYKLPVPALEYSALADQDWATSWQQFFKPFAIVPGLIIKPSWEDYTVQPGEQVLEIDPGMAFGTGQHASTKLALSLMQGCFHSSQPPKTMLDVGAGTGILAMAAARFGAEELLAVDNDPEAVQAAAENISRNHLSGLITVSAVPLAEISNSYDLICANILHDVLVHMAPDIAQRLTAQGCAVLAGILRGEQEENIIHIYSKLGLSLRQWAYEEEWAALLLAW